MKIEFQFIKQGLEKLEKCYYTTQDPAFIKKKMSDFRIDVGKYMKKDLLHFIQIPESFEEYAKMITPTFMSLTTLRQPISLVSTHEFRFNKSKRTFTMEEIEQCVHDNFAKLPGSMICSFPVKKIGKKLREKYMSNMLKSHHAVIFAPIKGKGAAFNLP